MKRGDVRIGETYSIKANGRPQVVRVVRESVWGGWDCRNLTTGRMVRIKTGKRFRQLVGARRMTARVSPLPLAGQVTRVILDHLTLERSQP